MFLLLGLGAVPGCIVWDLVARRTGEINALILAAVLQIAGILLPVFGKGLFLALCGAVLFGATFVGTVSLVLTMAGRYYPTRPAKMMGKMTLSYGLAQVITPGIIGSLAVHLGGDYQAGLYIAAGVMAIGTLLLVSLRVIEARAHSNTESAGARQGLAASSQGARYARPQSSASRPEGLSPRVQRDETW